MNGPAEGAMFDCPWKSKLDSYDNCL